MPLVLGATCKDKKPRSAELDTGKVVNVFHPGYHPRKHILILVAYADRSGNRGVPFYIVLWACQILANNMVGKLRAMNADADLTEPNGDRYLLPPGNYEYRVPGEVKYAVCTRFRAWSLPESFPESLPSRWSVHAMGTGLNPPSSTESSLSDVVKADDEQCVVTGEISRRKTSYLVPEGETAWWIYHDMSGKTGTRKGINSPSNCVSLRADLNAGLEEGHILFAPFDGKAACICITADVADFATEYHLRAFDMPGRIHPLNVYVRFAWSLFKAMEAPLRYFEMDHAAVTVEELDLSGFNADGGGDKEQGKEQSKDDAGSLLSGDDESSSDPATEPSLDLCVWTERDLEVAESLDANLGGRPLAPYEEEAGMYPGYSKMLRLQKKYRKEHPEVSAVRSARVAHVGEDTDERWL